MSEMPKKHTWRIWQWPEFHSALGFVVTFVFFMVVRSRLGFEDTVFMMLTLILINTEIAKRRK